MLTASSMVRAPPLVVPTVTRRRPPPLGAIVPTLPYWSVTVTALLSASTASANFSPSRVTVQSLTVDKSLGMGLKLEIVRLRGRPSRNDGNHALAATGAFHCTVSLQDPETDDETLKERHCHLIARYPSIY